MPAFSSPPARRFSAVSHGDPSASEKVFVPPVNVTSTSTCVRTLSLPVLGLTCAAGMLSPPMWRSRASPSALPAAGAAGKNALRA